MDINMQINFINTTNFNKQIFFRGAQNVPPAQITTPKDSFVRTEKPKKLNPSQKIKQHAIQVFEKAYKEASARLNRDGIKHYKPCLAFMNNKNEEFNGMYDLATNTVIINIAQFNHLSLGETEYDEPIIVRKDEKKYIENHPRLKQRGFKYTPILKKGREILLSSTINHELQHFEQLHRLLAAKNGQELVLQKDLKKVPREFLDYIIDFEPEIKYTLSKSFPVPQNKILRRSQYNGYDLINSLKQWDYKKSSTEILAWIDEMLRAEKALKQDNLSEHERKVWRAVKADAINTLTNSCL